MASEKPEESKKIDSQERAVLYSNNLLRAFEEKAKEFNGSHHQRVTLHQIKSIYLNAVGYEISPETKNLYAFARINLFFDMVTGKESFLTGACPEVEDAKPKPSALQFEFINLRNVSYSRRVEKAIDFFEQNLVTDEHYSKAKEDVAKYDIDFALRSAEEELFLTNDKKNNYLWEIL